MKSFAKILILFFLALSFTAQAQTQSQVWEDAEDNPVQVCVSFDDNSTLMISTAVSENPVRHLILPGACIEKGIILGEDEYLTVAVDIKNKTITYTGKKEQNARPVTFYYRNITQKTNR